MHANCNLCELDYKISFRNVKPVLKYRYKMASSSSSGTQKPPESMRRVDFTRDDLSLKDKEYIEKMTEAHKKNVERLTRAKTLKKNGLVALVLGACSIGVYAYSIYAVSQESFLEDFEEPKK